MSRVELDPSDAAELAEMLTFIRNWLTGPDRHNLAQSFQHFMGIDTYTLTDLATDLARFTFLLGHDDGEHLFSPDQP
jgi:hypothetical protein